MTSKKPHIADGVEETHKISVAYIRLKCLEYTSTPLRDPLETIERARKLEAYVLGLPVDQSKVTASE